MAAVYKTISGDTWDGIARAVYGSESYVSLLMSSNQELLDYFIFPAGITLAIEDLPEETGTLPDWRS